MHRRFIFVFFLPLYTELSIANSGAWNCEKVEGEEWSCNALPSSGEPEQPEFPTSDSSAEAPITLPEPVPFKPAPVYVQPPKTVAKRQGWTCTSAEEGEESWNCSLIGSDPKGKARVIDGEEYSSGLLTAAFDFNQEQVFDTLQSQLKYDPWENCMASSRIEPLYTPGKDLRNTSPMDVRADYSEVFDKEITSFFGNVEIIRADQNVLSDMASYDSISDTMDAQGHVFYSEDELSLYSDTALLNLGTDEARLRKALFISPASPIRGSADVVYRDSKMLSRYKEVAFTSCRPGNQDWVMHAKRLKMNKLTGKAAAKHAWLEFKGLPVLYTPYISFPLDDRRLSGFLPPTWGSNDRNGFDIVAPYYWNIAPNYDLTVWPRYMANRGGMLGGDFRYLTKMTSGSVGIDFLPSDGLRKVEGVDGDVENEYYGKARYSGTIKNTTTFTPNLNSNLNLNYVSDKDYFIDLNNALGISNDRHLRSDANLNYSTEGVSLTTRLEAYQTIDRSIADSARPYQKLPEVNLRLNHEFEDWPVDIAAENQYVNFYRDGRVSGQRLSINPSVTMPLETAGSFLKPKVSLQHSQYYLTDQAKGNPNSINRTLPVFSVDSGLFFEKDFKIADSSYMHTIEPRLFYLYIPEEDQKDIPIFDTSTFDFNFSSLFRENRFSGKDRIQDANQVTVAMTTRLIDSDNGAERLNLSVGEIFYFKDREVVISGAPETNQLSNVVAELSGQLTDHLSFTSGVQWNPDVNDFTRAQFDIRYRNQPEQIINLGYRYRRDNPNAVASIIQSDASFRWPLYDNWFGVGRWQYSLKLNSTKESFLGLEKESCCWRFRVVWRRFTNSLSNSTVADEAKMDQGIFLQIELKGLTSFGDKVDDFLEKNLNGYQRPK
ncbi:MAG: LPS assembly protein LptD [Methylococcales bacterium]|nr:LPS assembly protein LptD [Methylococcales bacterium]